MTSLAEFQRQRGKVLVPATASTRRLRRRLERKVRLAGQPRAFQGIVARDERIRLIQAVAPLHKRHENVMDPFKFPTYRHPQARRLERIARGVAADMGWNIKFDSDGAMRHVVQP